jgi:hypothetical protein
LITVADEATAQGFFELMRTSSSCDVDPLVILHSYARSIGYFREKWATAGPLLRSGGRESRELR